MSENDDDSDSECVVEKKRKYTGAFQYKTSFIMNGERIGCLLHLYQGYHMNSDAKFVKKSDLWASGSRRYWDHESSQKHQALPKSLSTQPKLSFNAADPLQDKVLHLSL